MTVQVILLGLLSMVACLDRRTAMHLMLSRPLVVAVIAGLILGDVEQAVLYGILFEILGLVDVPVGTHIPKDDTFAAYAFTVMAHFVGLSSAGPFIVGMFVTLFAMVPVTWSELAARRLNRTLFIAEQMHGREGFDARGLIGKGIAMSVVRGLVVYNVGTALVIAVMFGLMPYIPKFETGMEQLLAAIVVMLAGFLLRFLSAKSWIKYVMFIGGILVGWVLV